MEMRVRIKNVLAPSVLLAANVFVFGTFTVYQGNADEFDFGFIRLLGVYVPLFCITITILLVVGLLLSRKRINTYISLLFTLGVLFWLQGSFLVWDYGVFDARGINWEHFSWQGWVDLSIWLLLFMGAVVFADKISKISKVASLGFIILQLIVVFVVHITTEKNLWTKEYTVQNSMPEELLAYSSSQNIVHIILDSFQTDVFLDLVEEYGLQEDLEGFIVFKENMGVCPHTSFSIPAVFSGKIYDGKVPATTYYRERIKEGFQNRLYDEGFVVNLVPEISMRDGKYTTYYATPSVYQASSEELLFQNAAYLIDVVLFRQFPHFIRKKIYNDNSWLLSAQVSAPPSSTSFQQKAFFRNYIEHIQIGSTKPAYHFMHLMPPHPPYVTTKDGTYAGKVLPNTRENYKTEARYILKLFIELLNRLRDLGIYDSSLIILQGDHGSQILPVMGGKKIDIGRPRVPALLTMKPPHRKGKLRISSAKTSLSDIPATIMDTLGLKHVFEGTSVLKIDPIKPRKRLFITCDEGKQVRRIATHWVNGSIFNPESWHDGKIISVSRGIAKYDFGTVVQFGMTGNAEPFMGSGWSTQLNHHGWNNGDRANLNFVVEMPENDITFEAKFIPFIHQEKVKKQRIYVLVNGKKVSEWIATERKIQTFQATIAKELVNSENLRITFCFPDAVSPKSIDAGGDGRKLAIAMISARLYQKSF